ncbi:MAG TPA: aspartate aminotransferase family protein [Gaiellaceae bacterium]|nr:aspartate aminotransferase family protein [Gaiellaceae bacterium]
MISELLAADPFESYARSVNPQFVRMLRAIGFDRRWARAEGAYLFDADGNRFLDLLGGYGMFNVGRNNPRVREALVETLELETPGSVQLGVDALPGALADELLHRLPDRLGKVLFTNSGTEAVEAAIKMARGATRRHRVLGVEHAFHGLTTGSLAVGDAPEFRRPFGALLPGCDHVASGDLEALERELRRDDVALLIVEPIQGKGVNLHPPGYLAAAQRLCREHGTLFCVDEIQTGLGRTGRMFAFEHDGLEPDMVTIAKSISGGYVPSGALVLRTQDLLRVFDSLEHAVLHGSTFAPNDLAMAAGLATLRELDEQRLVARAQVLGDRLLDATRPLVERYEVVREVRGRGLMWAIEFGEPERGSRAWRAVERAQHGLFAQFVVVPLFTDHHVLSQVAGHGLNVVKGLPPLTLTEKDVDGFAAALDAVLARAERIPRSAARFALKLGTASLSRRSS